MSLYAVPVTIEDHYWAMKLLVEADTSEHAKAYAAAQMGPVLERAGIRDASKFVVGEPVQL